MYQLKKLTALNQDDAINKRLDDLEAFINELTEAAKPDNKNIEINIFELPITKKLFLDELNKRHKGNRYWGVRISTFNKTWSTNRRRNMCDVKSPTMKKGKVFLKNILG